MAEKASTELILEQRAKDGAPAQGVWHSDFKAVKAAAEQTGRPMIAMWLNPGCGYCKRFCTAATSDQFVRWMKDSVAYFWLGSRTDGDAANEGREFVFKQSDDPEIKDTQRFYFPGVAVWQCTAGKPDEVLHDYRASGRVFEQEKGGDEGITNVITRIQKALQEPPYKTFVPPPRAAAQTTAQGGGCPGGHPHLKVLKQINELIRPFFPVPQPKPEVTAEVLPLVRFVPGLDEQKRFRIVQAIVDNGGHCPCKNEKTPDTVCLCKEFRMAGTCACGLFERYA